MPSPRLSGPKKWCSICFDFTIPAFDSGRYREAGGWLTGKGWTGASLLLRGAGRGIGRAIALAYAAEGARLALSARTAAELEDTARLVAERFGGDVITAAADVSSREQVERAVALALERYGAIDVMVNNAGNIGPGGAGLG